MAERDEFTPKWDGPRFVPGTFIWTVYVKACVFREGVSQSETRPYMDIRVLVEDPPDGPEEPMNGAEMDFKIWLHQKAAGWCLYFLKKFDYPAEMLADEHRPIIRRQEVVGLHGKVLVNVKEGENGFLLYDVKGFDHLSGNELEKRVASKANGTPREEASVNTMDITETAIDLQADLKSSPPTEQAAPEQQSIKDFVDSCDPETPNLESGDELDGL